MIEATLTYREIHTMVTALGVMANRDLPDIKAHLRVGKCIRRLKPHLVELQANVDIIQKAHRVEEQVAGEGEPIRFSDPTGMRLEINAEYDKQVTVELPDPITEAMLPKPTKTKPDNAEGVAGFLADLGPLYDIPEDA